MMNTRPIFEETQSFTSKAVRQTIDLTAVLLLAGSAVSLIVAQRTGTNATEGFLEGFVILGVLSFLLKRARLITQVREDGIYVKFSPFHKNTQAYTWDMLSLLYIREYNGLYEYGGWGLKMMPAAGSAFTISGTVGLQLVFTDNTRLLIGTNDAEHLAEALHGLGKLDFPPDSLFRP